MWIYYLGCASLGLIAGFLVGGSASPVVQYVLPLLFSLLGGATGILALAINPTSREGRVRFQVLGMAITAVTIPFLVAATYAATLRAGMSLADLVPRVTAPIEQPTLSDAQLQMLDPEGTLELLLLNRNLRLVGLPDSERRKIITRLADARAQMVTAFIGRRSSLMALSQQLAAALTAAQAQGRLKDNSNVEALRFQLSGYQAVAGAAGAWPGATERAAVLAIRELLFDESKLYSSTVSAFASDQAIASIIASMKKLLADVAEPELLSAAMKQEIYRALDQQGPLNEKLIPLFARGGPDLWRGDS